MYFRNIIYLAFKNIILKKSAYFKILISFFLVFTLVLIVLFYSCSLSDSYKNYENNKIDTARYIVQNQISTSQESDIRNLNQVRSLTFTSLKSFNYKSEIILVIEDQIYELKKGMGGYVFGNIVDSRSDYSIPQNIQIAFSSLTNEEPILYGSDISTVEDIVLSELMLDWLGIIDRDELIGKSITIKNGEYSRSGILSGILNKKLYEMSLYDGSFLCFAEEGDVNDYVDISLKKFSDNESFFIKMNEMFGDEVTHYFCGNSDLEAMQLIEGQEILCKDFLSFICLIIIIVICIYIASNQFFLLQKNSIFYGILKASGVNNRSIFVVHMFELFFISIMALILALATSIGVFFIIQSVFSSVFYIELTFSIGIAIGYFIAFLCMAAALSFFITLFIYFKLLKRPTIYLLKN